MEKEKALQIIRSILDEATKKVYLKIWMHHLLQLKHLILLQNL